MRRALLTRWRIWHLAIAVLLAALVSALLRQRWGGIALVLGISALAAVWVMQLSWRAIRADHRPQAIHEPDVSTAGRILKECAFHLLATTVVICACVGVFVFSLIAFMLGILFLVIANLPRL